MLDTNCAGKPKFDEAIFSDSKHSFTSRYCFSDNEWDVCLDNGVIGPVVLGEVQ